MQGSNFDSTHRAESVGMTCFLVGEPPGPAAAKHQGQINHRVCVRIVNTPDSHESIPIFITACVVRL
jgi:hypothetical protein